MGASVILIVFLGCVFASIPIGFAIGLSCVAYVLTAGTINMGYIASGLFASCDSFPLMAIPFFILSGALMEGGGLSKRLVMFFDALVGHLTGGLAIVTVITCMFFGAISGSGPATTAAIGAIMVPTMVEKGYDKKFAEAACTHGTVNIIVGTSTILGRVLTLEQVPDMVANAMISISDNKIVILLIINLLLLACGCLLETNSSILILAPILYPVVARYGVDIVHFGLIMVVNLAIGFITPPVGVNLFVACGIGKIPFAQLVRKIIPFLIALLIGLVLITYVPAITLTIPRLTGYAG